MTDTPTRPQINAWATAHLTDAAATWIARADLIHERYEAARTALNETSWTGAGADQAHAAFAASVAEMSRVEGVFRQAAKTATEGATRISTARQAALDAISNAERALFNVSDDLKVTDRLPQILGPAQLIRKLLIPLLEADIQAKALALAVADDAVATALKEIDAQLHGQDGSDPADTPRQPRITGPAGPLQYEQDKYDLEVTFPDGKGPTFGGDPQTHDANWQPVPEVERDPDSEKARHVPDDGTRPIPTGTAIGPNGERIALFSYPDGKPKDPSKNPYSTPAEGWDFSDPDHPTPLGPLTFPGPDGKPMPIYQPSGAYDKMTGKMVFVGNITDDSGKIKRYMFESDPIKPGQKPADWMKTVKMSGEIEGLPGARESQLVALKGGGFALVGSDNFSADPNNPRPAVSAVVASSAEGLKTATPTTIIGPSTISGHPAAPYGPTVIDTTYDPVTGKETIDLRVSTWDGIMKPDHSNPYDPKTYTTSVTVQH